MCKVIIMPKRCILGCSRNTSITLHQFPNIRTKPEVFKQWVKIVGGKLENESDYDYYSKKVICDIHFTNEDKNRNNRLKFYAVPSLHLHDTIASLNIPPTLSSKSLLSQPSTSTVAFTGDTLNAPPILAAMEPYFCPPSMPALQDTIASLNIPPTLSLEPLLSQPSTSTAFTDKSTANAVRTEHNYCKQRSTKCKKIKRTRSSRAITSHDLAQLQTTNGEMKILKMNIGRLTKRIHSYKTRLEQAEDYSKSNIFHKLTKKMTLAAKIFTKMQYMQTQKKPRGRRFSTEEKILSLSMYKRSPKAYSLLANYFTLPSAKSLKRLLAEVKLEPGLNKSIYIKMKETVKELAPEDRLCCLLFDEMSITPQINFDSANDKLKGFSHQSQAIADHVLVFMVKGIKKKFKQPVAYYFTNSLKKHQLKAMIKEVLKSVQATGFKVICTICDQSAVNVSAINELIEETKKIYFNKSLPWRMDVMSVGGVGIIPLFDVPHLLKGIRNNLLNKELKYYDFEEKIEKTVKWEYFQKVYEADKSYRELTILGKITDEHMYVEKIRKMKVKTAAQVFSHSFAVAAEHLSGRGNVPMECRQIIKFVKLVDNLFDSLNCSSFSVPNGKIYKGCVKRHSPHHELWVNAIKVLKTMKFIERKSGKNNEIRLIERQVPSIKNFIRTIEGIQQIWKILSQKYCCDAMLTRNFNQDPLENFFGNIRSFGARNTAPNSIAFEGAFKALLLNNYNSPHSLHSNCEGDDNGCLQTLTFFLNASKGNDTQSQNTEEITNDAIAVPDINLDDNVKDAGQGNYVCGWVLVKCFKNICKNCLHCKNELTCIENRMANAYIRAKEFTKCSKYLLYPSLDVEKCFIVTQNIITDILKKDVPQTGLKNRIKMFTDIFVPFPFTCLIHKDNLKNYFEQMCSKVIIYSWCRSINRILSGKITYVGEDEVKTAAQLYFNKHKHK